MQFAFIGKESIPERTSPSEVPQAEQKHLSYLYGGSALYVVILSRPVVILNLSDLTNANDIAPTLRQRLQWHIPIMLGFSANSN